MRCWFGYLSGVRCRLFAYCPADATAVPKPHHLLHHLNPDWFYLSGTGLSRLSWKRPLNGCSSRSSSFSSCYSLSCVIPRTLYLSVVIDTACIVCGMSTMKLLSIMSVCPIIACCGPGSQEILIDCCMASTLQQMRTV